MNQKKSDVSVWSLINKKIFIPGVVCLLLFIAIGVVIPTQFNDGMNAFNNWAMTHFKWVYVFCAVLTSIFCIWCLFSKFGNIRFGGKDAKPSIKFLPWLTISLTGSIAIGICFFGVAGPVNNFLNPPEFLGVQGGTAEAVVPAIEFCFLHYGIPAYFIVTFAGFAIALVSFNAKRPFRASSALYPLIGDRCDGIIGTVVDTMMVLSLVIVGTNMGLSVIQLNAGISNLSGGTAPDVQIIIILIYVVATIFFACSGVHGTMDKLSNVNALFYVGVIAFVLICGGVNRLLGLYSTSVTQFIMDYIPFVGFADPVMQTGWQEANSMFFYSWNAMPGLLAAFFYASVSYGRTLKEFVLVNCLVPTVFMTFWYVFVGGTAIFGVMEGSNLPEVIAEQGSGIATFAFLDTLPFGSVTKWIFIFMAVMTFVTWSDAICFSFPLMFMKRTEKDASTTKTPKVLVAGTAIFMGLLTFTLVYVGGYTAMETSILCWGLPSSLLIGLLVISCFKFLFQRKKYDLTYQDELAAAKAAGIAVDDGEGTFPDPIGECEVLIDELGAAEKK